MTNSLPTQIVVTIQKMNGKDCIVPFCPKALTFANISGKKTLSQETINHIKFLGYSIKVKQEIKTLNSVFA